VRQVRVAAARRLDPAVEAGEELGELVLRHAGRDLFGCALPADLLDFAKAIQADVRDRRRLDKLIAEVRPTSSSTSPRSGRGRSPR
jgi:hypothetical protein